jgi:hypothetical protein
MYTFARSGLLGVAHNGSWFAMNPKAQIAASAAAGHRVAIYRTDTFQDTGAIEIVLPEPPSQYVLTTDSL